MQKRSIKDDQAYRVRLKAKAEALGRTLWPGRPYTLRGDVLKQIWEQVDSAQAL